MPLGRILWKVLKWSYRTQPRLFKEEYSDSEALTFVMKPAGAASCVEPLRQEVKLKLSSSGLSFLEPTWVSDACESCVAALTTDCSEFRRCTPGSGYRSELTLLVECVAVGSVYDELMDIVKNSMHWQDVAVQAAYDAAGPNISMASCGIRSSLMVPFEDAISILQKGLSRARSPITILMCLYR